MSKSTPPGDNPASPKPRRPKGSGSIKQRADGRWEVRLTLSDADGGTTRYSQYLPKTATRADAEAVLARLQTESRAGTLITQHKTINAALDAWLGALQKRVTPPPGSKRLPTMRPGTLAYYRKNADSYLRPRIGGVLVADLKPMHVQGLIDYWDARGLAPKSVAHVLGTLRALLNYALRQEWVLRNVAAGRLFDLPPAVRAPIRPFTEAEARAFLLAAADTRDAALWTVLLAFGLRASEALGLTWDAWDEAGRRLQVRQQLQRLDGAYSLAPLKTQASNRVLRVPPAVALALRGQRARQAAEREAAGAQWRDEIPGLIFTTAQGRPLSRGGVWDRFQVACAAAGLAGRSVHSTRHTAATLLQARGMPLNEIKQFLGHSQIATTADIYTHTTAQGQDQAADLIAAALWETG